MPFTKLLSVVLVVVDAAHDVHKNVISSFGVAVTRKFRYGVGRREGEFASAECESQFLRAGGCQPSGGNT